MARDWWGRLQRPASFSSPRKLKRAPRLVVVSHVVHYRHAGRLHPFGPYAREIDIWADLFDSVTIAAPCRCEPPPGDSVPFTRPHITLAPMPETGGHTLPAKLYQQLCLPRLVWRLGRAMLRADVVHVRCPGNLGLLGALLAPLLSRRHIAKYAGQWNGYAREPWTVRLQRAVLGSWWWRDGIVTVYGEWPEQPDQVVPFFTSILSREQVRQAARVAAGKKLESPTQLLYAGRLAAGKGLELLIQAAGLLQAKGLAFRLTIVGDGPERSRLEALARRRGLAEAVAFTGAVPFEEMPRRYEAAHVLVLPSAHEGWPKVLAEAMCHGLVCVSTGQGFIPRMLEGRGLLFPAGDSRALADRIERVLAAPDRFAALSRAGAQWARQHSLEDLRDALQDLMERKWCVALP